MNIRIEIQDRFTGKRVSNKLKGEMIKVFLKSPEAYYVRKEIEKNIWKAWEDFNKLKDFININRKPLQVKRSLPQRKRGAK